MKKTTTWGKLTAIMLFFAITLSLFPTAYAQDMVYAIDNVYFTDLSGTVLENPTTSCMVNVEVIKNVDRTANDLVVITSYSTDGAMIGFTIVGGTMQTGTKSTFSTLVVAPKGESLGVVKAYVWNNIAQMKPLSNAYTKIVNTLDDGVERPPVSEDPVEESYIPSVITVRGTVVDTARTNASLQNGEYGLSVYLYEDYSETATPDEYEYEKERYAAISEAYGIPLEGAYTNITVESDFDLASHIFCEGKFTIQFTDTACRLISFDLLDSVNTITVPASEYIKSTLLTAGDRFGDSAGASVGTGSGKIRFGSKYYTTHLLNTSYPPAYVADLYVNGAFATTVNSTVITTYTAAPSLVTIGTGANATLDQLIGGAQGDVKLIQQPSDNGYSAILLDYYDVAKVVSVVYRNKRTEIVLNRATNSIMSANKIVITDDNVDNGNVDISVKLGNSDIALKDLQVGDIIAVGIDHAAYAHSTTISDPNFINILVSRDTVTGIITGRDDDEETVEVDKVTYSLVDYASSYFAILNTYKMTLDPFGRIFAGEQVASSVKYAIAEKWTTNDEFQMLLADGTTKTMSLASGAMLTNQYGMPITINDVLYGTASPAPAATKAPVQNRVVEYTVKNSTGEITSIKQATPNTISNEEYNARTNKLGSVTVTDFTNIIDASNYAGRISEYDVLTGFVDETRYDAYSYTPAGSTAASFIIVTRVGSVFNSKARFAVVTKAAKAGTTEDLSSCWDVEVLYNGEATTFQFAYNNNPYSLSVGDAFFFELDGDGLVKAHYIVYDHSAKSYLGFANALPSPLSTYKYDSVTNSGWSFNLADEGKDIQLAYAIVTQANGNTVELAAVPASLAPSGSPVPVIDTNIGAVTSPTPMGAEYLAVADDAQIYMYDVADTMSIREQDKFSIGTMLASNFSMFETSRNSGLFYNYIDTDWDGYYDPGEEALMNYAYYALALIVDGDVVELYTITQ